MIKYITKDLYVISGHRSLDSDATYGETLFHPLQLVDFDEVGLKIDEIG